MRNVFLAALALMLVAGCSKGIRYSPGELELFSPEVREHIIKKEVALGMPQAAVRYIWGAPKVVKVIPEENKEIWVYSDIRVYVTKLTFVDGKLTSSTSKMSLNNPLTQSDKEKDSPEDGSKASPGDQSGEAVRSE